MTERSWAIVVVFFSVLLFVFLAGVAAVNMMCFLGFALVGAPGVDRLQAVAWILLSGMGVTLSVLTPPLIFLLL